MLVGFQIFPGQAKWSISPGSPTLWVSFCERPIFTENDLPSEDPLAGQAINFDSLSQSIFDDYNNLASTYFRLADAATDPGYDPVLAASRTINVCFSSLPIGRSGQSARMTTGSSVTGCKITMLDSIKDSAISFVSVLTHEMGHCMGLDHPQDTTHAIMSYFRTGSSVRLQIDDKMGLVFLYATNADDSRESPNGGFGCSAKN